MCYFLYCNFHFRYSFNQMFSSFYSLLFIPFLLENMKRHFDDFCIQINASIITHHLRIANDNSIGVIVVIWCDCDAFY